MDHPAYDSQSSLRVSLWGRKCWACETNGEIFLVKAWNIIDPSFTEIIKAHKHSPKLTLAFHPDY
jgi:hypothetical protein